MIGNNLRIPERFRSHPIFNEILCGTNFGFMAKRGYYFREEVKKQPALMAKAGINWTTLNMNFCQDTYFSHKVYLDFQFSSSEAEITEMTKRLHDNGIRVLFKPCLTPLDGAWMGNVNFPTSLNQIAGVKVDYWEPWFESFIEAEKYFADLAQRAGMDAMMVGAEYWGTEGQNDHWERAIDAVRGIYSQPITYEFTPYSANSHDLKWVEKLDFISHSYYPAAAAPNMQPLDPDRNPTVAQAPHRSVEDMVDYLQVQKEHVRKLSERFGNMPIAFTEFGTRSAHGCIMQPYNFMWDTPYDGQEQADYMEAGFRTFSELEPWMGLFWWKWDETQIRPQYHGDPHGDRGFTIQGKPAEEVMRQWCLKNKERRS